MKTVQFYCPKGGVGSTTLAAHFARYAARRGIATLAVSVDQSGHLIELLDGRDESLVQDSVRQVEFNLTAMYCPYEVPDFASLEVQPDLVVVDTKHDGREEQVLPPVDLWLVPITCGQSLRNFYSGMLTNRLGNHAQQTVVVPNRQSWGSSKVHDAKQLCTAGSVWEVHPVAIPDAGSFSTAGLRGTSVWDTRFKRSWSARRLAEWAEHTLVLVGLALPIPFPFYPTTSATPSKEL